MSAEVSILLKTALIGLRGVTVIFDFSVCPLAFFHVDPGQPRHRDHGIHHQPRILPVSQRGCKELWKMITTATRKPCVLHSTREYPRSFIEMKLLLELQLAPVEASKKQRSEKAETLLCQQRSV